jgi:hypothetical protein
VTLGTAFSPQDYDAMKIPAALRGEPGCR